MISLVAISGLGSHAFGSLKRALSAHVAQRRSSDRSPRSSRVRVWY